MRTARQTPLPRPRRSSLGGCVLWLGVGALTLASCAYRPTGKFTAGDFRMRSYRTISVSPSTGDRALAPLANESRTATRTALRAHLERLGYQSASPEAAELVVYTGLADGPDTSRLIVIRVADRARGELVWQRAAPYETSMGPAATAAVCIKLMARFRKASRPPST